MNRSTFLTLASTILFISVMAYSTIVLARSSGISGRSITGCTCHNDTPDPGVSVSIFGPTIANLDATYNYTLTLTGGPLVLGGLDVSVTNGTLVVTDSTNTQLDSGEITHTEAGTSLTSWSFNWTAPSTYGNATMYGAAISADGNGKTSGDLWNRTFLNITVTIPGDVNGDRIVDIFDIGYISAHWYPGPPIGPLGYHPNADVNNDGAVDIFDIGITSAHWGESW